MTIQIERPDDSNTVTVMVSDVCGRSESAKFDRSNWISGCECIAGLLEKILVHQGGVRLLEERIALLKKT